MKELEEPHNDWWRTPRPLEFGRNIPSTTIREWLTETVDASDFAGSVRNGMEELFQSSGYLLAKKSLTLQEQLRPLFCTTEINLVAAAHTDGPKLKIPSAHFINPLVEAEIDFTLSKDQYHAALQSLGSSFPETQLKDADHAWLAPVKGYSDLRAIQSLIDQGIVDRDFVRAILSIDLANALFSARRCSLLKLVPLRETPNWQDQILSHREGEEARQSEIANIQRMLRMHSQELIKQLFERREAVFRDEISRNPRGQILEPGFRVIFPTRTL